MDTDYDSPWKEALDEWFAPFLAFFFPHVHREIDWTRGYEGLDKELQQVTPDAEQGRRYADKLVRVWLHDGSEEWLLIHIEVQGQREKDFERRVFVYNYRIFDKYNRTVVSLVVLADDEPGWRPRRFAFGRWGSETSLQFPSVKLLDLGTDEMALAANANPFSTIVLAHLKALATQRDVSQRHLWKTQLVRGLYDRGLSANDVRQLFRLIDWIMRLPPALEGLFWADVQKFEEERRMPYVTSVERMAIEKGRRQQQLEDIEHGLRFRFGDEGPKLMPEITHLQDTTILRQIQDAILAGASLDDLRKIWQS